MEQNARDYLYGFEVIFFFERRSIRLFRMNDLKYVHKIIKFDCN